MRIDRADIEQKAEDARYHLDQIRKDPERMRKYVAAAVLAVVCFVTAVIWIARLIPDAAPEDEAQAQQTSEQKTTESWLERTTRKLQRDDRFRNVTITHTGSRIIVQGRVDNDADLRDLRQLVVQSAPPAAMDWSISTDEP